MVTTEYMIKTLREYAEKHKNDIVRTFDINVPAMCFDVADRLEELAKGKHGYWVFTGRTYKCSNCCLKEDNAVEADSCDLPILNFKYCPHCGAEMDIKEE